MIVQVLIDDGQTISNNGTRERRCQLRSELCVANGSSDLNCSGSVCQILMPCSKDTLVAELCELLCFCLFLHSGYVTDNSFCVRSVSI